MLEILLRTSSYDEEKFYFEIFKNKDFIFHKKSDDFCNFYNVIDSAMLSVSLNNTLDMKSCEKQQNLFY